MKWIQIVELIVLIVTAALAVPQLFLLRKQMKNQHEERRRENTIQFMITWCNSLKKDTCIAEQVARKLNTDQCQALYRHQSFEVAESIKKEICKFCPLDCSVCNECKLKNSNVVDGKILTELRWHVITYLNTLETVLISWDLGIVDRKTIEEQFEFLNDVSKGSTLSEFRRTAGGYPVIEAFIDTIKGSTSSPRQEL